MTFNEVRKFLCGCVREERYNSNLGNVESQWKDGIEIIATGFFGSCKSTVYVNTGGICNKFIDVEASQLGKCGTRKIVV